LIGKFFYGKYYNPLGEVRLSQQKEVEYTDNGQLVRTTDYEYYDIANLDLTKKVVNNTSTGDQLTTELFYPVNLKDTSQVLTGMVDRNIVTPVIKKDVYRSSGQISGEITDYNPRFLPSRMRSWIPVSNVYETRVALNKYDAQGNLVSYIKDNAVKGVYLWGYNNTYPVAQIQNATYDQVKSALGVTSGDIDLGANGLTAAQEAALRNNIPFALVTTFTYEPLKGMKSQTDSNGVTTYYDYDELGRLKVVKDRDQHPVSQYEYYFKQ
jgi:YD repeat-containing protein